MGLTRFGRSYEEFARLEQEMGEVPFFSFKFLSFVQDFLFICGGRRGERFACILRLFIIGNDFEGDKNDTSMERGTQFTQTWGMKIKQLHY